MKKLLLVPMLLSGTFFAADPVWLPSDFKVRCLYEEAYPGQDYHNEYDASLTAKLLIDCKYFEHSKTYQDYLRTHARCMKGVAELQSLRIKLSEQQAEKLDIITNDILLNTTMFSEEAFDSQK